jgi:predicted GNAT superfamily acetyltransferase
VHRRAACIVAMTIVPRPFVPGDAAALLAINAASHPHVAALDAQALQCLLALGAEILIARTEAGVVAAYLILVAGDRDYDGEEFLALRARFGAAFLYIDQIAVAEPARRLGAARCLYQAAVGIAVVRGLRRLCCEVNTRPPNPDSLAFHLALGFEVLAPFGVSDGRQVALLTRSLGDNAPALSARTASV